QTRPRGYELFSNDRSSYASSLLDQIPDCQVVNVHWIPGLVDYQSFFTRLPPLTPVVWTLHDMNALTGGCRQHLGCDRYLADCGACPQIGSRDPKDLSHRIWTRKRTLFSKVVSSRLHLVAPSRWLGDEVRRSPILSRFPLHVIPNGLDLED